MSEALDGWDQQLVETGVRIMVKRGELILKLSEDTSRLNELLSGNKRSLSLIYKPSFKTNLNHESPMPPFVKGDKGGLNCEQSFWEALEKVRAKERKWGKTLVGPHLDELEILLADLNLRHFGSEGEQRTAAIALKLGMAQLLKKEKGESPILLLDEVFAELDQDRSMSLLSLLSTEFDGQVFIATAKGESLEEKVNGLSRFNPINPMKDFWRFQVEKGEVKRVP